ncbi:MAG: septal ring lytic transglycosylase RlpA family protein [Hyphomicrobium sp.]
MRTFIYFAVSVVTFGLLTLAPASAATYWKCMGADVACASSKSAAAGSSRNYRSNGRVYTKRAGRRSATKRSTSRRSSAGSKPRRNRTRVASLGSTRAGRSAGSGLASYYWQGQRTASGARFNPNGLTAAHRTLPFGTKVRVTNKRNGRSVVVTINDRGPFIRGRVIDLSKSAAQVIGMTGAGVAPVSLDVL